MCKCVEYFFVFLSTPFFEILLLLLFWRRVMLHHFYALDWSTYICFYSFWAYTFFSDLYLLLQEYKKRNLLETLEYLLLVGGWHVLRNPGVEVSLYMWVYVISIMGAWKDSNKGHDNLAKLNGSQASICRKFLHWYRHMALVGDMIINIEKLFLFYFLKRNHSRFSPYYEIEQDQHCLTISY
jgi:hypothetical protein